MEPSILELSGLKKPAFNSLTVLEEEKLQSLFQFIQNGQKSVKYRLNIKKK